MRNKFVIRLPRETFSLLRGLPRLSRETKGFLRGRSAATLRGVNQFLNLGQRPTSLGLASPSSVIITAVFAVVITGVLGFGGSVRAATITADSCSYTDVSAAVSVASSEDTVIVPAGTATWSSTLVITKGLTLQGAGIDSTVIIASGIDLIISFSVSGNHAIDISGFTLDANETTNSKCLYIQNSSTSPLYDFRAHHNKFTNAEYMAVCPRGIVFGLVDNNQFVDNNYDFKVYGKQQDSWTYYPASVNIGTANYFYIESNTSSGAKTFLLASGEGARWVYRYNTIDNSVMTPGCTLWDVHGDTRNYGVVAVEIYENTVTSEIGSPARSGFRTLDYRGGTGMVYNNSAQAGSLISVREEYNPRGGENGCWDPVTGGYLWNNTNSLSGRKHFVGDNVFGDYDRHDCIAEDTDWWDDAPDTVPDANESPLNFAYDIAANRPGTCTDDDCYWETDTRKLYRCDGDNNWIFVYTSYTYPHPLRNEADTTPPSRSNPQPTGTLSSGTTSTTISLDTNETAVCKYSVIANTNYDGMSNVFAMTDSTDHSTDVTDLEDGNSYTYYIRCQDESGNANTDDFEISFSIASSTTYGISNFIQLVTDWLKAETGLTSDVNGDGVVNTRDLGIMMSNWQN